MAGTIKNVLVTILERNGVQFLPALGRTPIKREVDCDHLKTRGVHYLVPNVVNGVVESYYARLDKPNSGFLTDSAGNPVINDAIKCLEIWDNRDNSTTYIMLTSGQTENTFTEFCNQCCGAGNDFSVDPATIPVPIIENTVCPVPASGSQTYTFKSTPPANPFSSNVTLNNFHFNGGQPPAVALTTGGYASLAAFVTWANTNLGAMGTWSVNGSGQLQLVSTTVSTINLDIALVPLTYCLTFGSAFTANTLVVNDASNNPINIPITPITASAANATNVLSLLTSYLPGTLTVQVVSSVNHVQYIGLQKPIKLTDGTNNANFTLGAC